MGGEVGGGGLAGSRNINNVTSFQEQFLTNWLQGSLRFVKQTHHR